MTCMPHYLWTHVRQTVPLIPWPHGTTGFCSEDGENHELCCLFKCHCKQDCWIEWHSFLCALTRFIGWAFWKLYLAMAGLWICFLAQVELENQLSSLWAQPKLSVTPGFLARQRHWLHSVNNQLCLPYSLFVLHCAATRYSSQASC